MPNQVEIPNDIILPEPTLSPKEYQMQLNQAIQDWTVQVRSSLEKINELLP